jgi:hypothetical protein
MLMMGKGLCDVKDQKYRFSRARDSMVFQVRDARTRRTTGQGAIDEAARIGV